MDNLNNLATRKGLALMLKVSTRTIRRMELKGLPVIRIGELIRYDIGGVLDWISLNKFSKEINHD